MSGVAARSVQRSGSPTLVRTACGRARAGGRSLARSEQDATTEVFTAAHHAAIYAAPPAPALVGQTMTIPVTVRNFGAGVWSASGVGAVALSYHLYDTSGAL